MTGPGTFGHGGGGQGRLGDGRRGSGLARGLVSAVAGRPRPFALALGGLVAVGGFVILMLASSVQALVTMADQGAALAQQTVIDEEAREQAERETGAGAGESGGRGSEGQWSTSGQPTSPVGPDDVVAVEGIRVHHSIADQVAALLEAARDDGIVLSGWGWRDNRTQIRLRRQHCGTSDYAIYRMPSSQCSPPTARPGRSQHERGLAIDFTYNGGSISSHRNAGFRWLAANAAIYGLKNLPSEPWHWSTTGR